MKVFIGSYQAPGGIINADSFIVDSGGNVVGEYVIPTSPASNTPQDVWNAITSAIVTYVAGVGYTITAADIYSLVVPARTFTTPARSLNSAFQISVLQDVQVSYAVDIAATLSLTTGQTGTVVLEYADNSGMSTNVVTLQSAVNGNTGTLAIGLGLTQTATVTLTGIVPAGKYVRLRTVNTTGTPTFTFRTAQEVLL